jgi:hypothetical protein
MRRLVRRGCLCLSAKGLTSKVEKVDDGQTVAEVRCGAETTPLGDCEHARTADHSRAKSTGWDENRVFLEGDKVEVAVVNGRWVLTHQPAKPPEPKAVQHYFPDEE